MARIRPESKAAILQHDSTLRRHQRAAERMEQRADEANGVAVAINDRQIGRIAVAGQIEARREASSTPTCKASQPMP
jgi:hypothetical protein